MRRGTRHKVTIYPVKNSGRWKWKFETNKRVVAKADYSWNSRAAALEAFNGFAITLWGYIAETCITQLDGTTVYKWHKY